MSRDRDIVGTTAENYVVRVGILSYKVRKTITLLFPLFSPLRLCQKSRMRVKDTISPEVLFKS